MKINELLKNGIKELNDEKIEEAILKTKLLLQYLLNVNNQYLLIHQDDEIEEDIVKNFEKEIKKLINGIPIQYITNNQTFYGLDFFVNENVLIPQPDTEILVEEVIDISKEYNRKIKILDICTGSGAIAIALKKNIDSEIFASDISPNAIEIAKRNANSNEVSVKFIESNMFTNIKGKYDIIVSNPPYIETQVIDSLSKEVKNEPIIALDGGEDGLDFYRILASKSKEHLNNNGYLALEIGYDQKDDVMKILKNEGYIDIYSKKDYSQNDRIVIGKWR